MEEFKIFVNKRQNDAEERTRTLLLRGRPYIKSHRKKAIFFDMFLKLFTEVSRRRIIALLQLVHDLFLTRCEHRETAIVDTAMFQESTER